METALMITEYNDGLQWRETGRQIRKISDFKSLKARQGAVDSPYVKRTWCAKHRVKIEDRNLDGERVRSILIWQEANRFIPVRYWHGE